MAKKEISAKGDRGEEGCEAPDKTYTHGRLLHFVLLAHSHARPQSNASKGRPPSAKHTHTGPQSIISAFCLTSGRERRPAGQLELVLLVLIVLLVLVLLVLPPAAAGTVVVGCGGVNAFVVSLPGALGVGL